MPSKYPKGSEWRKWDLHLHSPYTRLESRYGNDWEAYLDVLAKADFAVYGITNYFCFAPSELEMVRDGLSKRGAHKTIIGNLEFRIDQPNKHGDHINVHVLFSDALSTEAINTAIARLPLINTADAKGQLRIYCSDEDVRKAGLDFKKILVSFETLIQHLKSHFKRSDYLMACCPSGYGSFRPAKGEGRGAGLAVEIDKDSDLFFGDTEDRKFFLQKDRYDGAIQKPVVAGSDAHALEEIGRRFFWVKAHPTFEGLRQTLFEPEERVSLTPENPLAAFPKPYFSSIDASGGIVAGQLIRFGATRFPLNPGLVTIIGGRGTGKSVLLDCVYRRFHVGSSKDDRRLSELSPDHFAIDFTKQDGTEKITVDADTDGALTYLHVRQGDIRRLAESADGLSDEIKKLLGLQAQDVQDALDLDMEAILEQMEDIKRWFYFQDEEGNQINSKSYNEKVVKVNEERIKAITSKENKVLVEQFNKNAGIAARIRGTQQRLVGLKAKLAQVQQDLTREITAINSVLATYGLAIPNLDTSPQTNSLFEIEQKLNGELGKLTKENAEIQQRLRSQGIEQDPAGLLDKVSVFQKAITEAQQRIEDFKARTESLTELLARRQEMARTLMDRTRTARDAVDKAFDQLKTGREGWSPNQVSLVQKLLAEVNVAGEIVFDQEAFYAGLLRVLDGRKFRQTSIKSQREKLAERFSVATFDEYSQLLDGEALIFDEDGNKINAEQFSRHRDYFVPFDEYSFLEYLYLPRFQQKYLRVRANIKYRDKSPDRLSVGQRGTFYVCMKLATDPFGSPFVFDQPEDDLDNEFIVQELVPLFREIKKYRQIIIATHNANLVVNADAEQILIADNQNECLSYTSGALEDSDVRDAVCTILEGGKEAFQKREHKYGFV